MVQGMNIAHRLIVRGDGTLDKLKDEGVVTTNF